MDFDKSKPRAPASRSWIARVLNRVKHDHAVDFISLCLKPQAERPDARTLLAHRFFAIASDDDDEVALGNN
jgi:hypothetical protein